MILDGKELTPSVDYTVTDERDEAADIGLVTVVGKGNYSGTCTLSYKPSMDSSLGEDGEPTETDLPGSWFSRNAIWVLPVGVILLEAAAICIYFLAFKKQNPIKGVLEFVKRKKSDGEDDPTDSE